MRAARSLSTCRAYLPAPLTPLLPIQRLPPLCSSGASGFLLPLSGGADSSSVAAIVGCMCQMVCEAAAAGDADVLADTIRCVRVHVCVCLEGSAAG